MGGSAYHSYHTISPSFPTSYSGNFFHDYHRPITTSKAPTVRNVTTQAANRPLVSRATTSKILMEPQAGSSAPSANVSASPNLFATMESEIKSYISKEKDLCSGLKYELSLEEFQAFREEAKKSLPGWEKLKYVIIWIQYPCHTDFNTVSITKVI